MSDESPFVETEEVAGKTLVKGAKLRPVDGLWPIERVCIPELAAVLYEQIIWGGERHPAQIAPEEYAAWELVRDRWIAGTQHMLELLAAEDNVRLYP